MKLAHSLGVESVGVPFNLGWFRLRTPGVLRGAQAYCSAIGSDRQGRVLLILIDAKVNLGGVM